jgi:hypothetical protein
MDERQQKEQFSLAWLHTVATVSGLVLSDPRVDEDSVDATLMQRGGGGPYLSPRLDVQLKCSGRPVEIRAGGFSFALPIKNFNELRIANVLVPRILVVLLVPREPDAWLDVQPEHMLARKAAYWLSLRGRDGVDNIDNVTVHLPLGNQLTVQTLKDIMTRISAGGMP